MERRLQRLARIEEAKDRDLAIAIEREICRRDVHHFFDQWVWTYNPKNAGTELPVYLPLDPFHRQHALLDWLDARLAKREDGLIEKSRDVGFTWTAGGWAVHKWIFVSGFKTSFGSRKQDLVDSIGDPDSIFEKLRILIKRLPSWMLPAGWLDHFLILTNIDNGNTITGESGDEMGRGGRSSAYIIDEAAFLERADRVEGATSATADVRIWGSSANGIGNLFHRKRVGGTLRPEQIFRLHYSDDPRKTPEWVAAKKSSMEDHTWASEYEIDYSASVEGICIPGRYVDASQKIAALLREKRGIEVAPTANGVAGLDVGGGGKARSVAIARFGPIVTVPESWGEPDTNETAARALDYAERQKPARLDRIGLPGAPGRVTLVNYDNVGVGHGALGVMQRGRRGVTTGGINTGVPPSDRQWPDGERSEEKFGNLKAELWFLLRERFKNTFELLLFLEGRDGGRDHPPSDIIVLPPSNASPDVVVLAGQISSVKWARNEKGKIVMETKAQLRTRGIPSPDHAEALVLTMVESNVVDEWRRALGMPRKAG